MMNNVGRTGAVGFNSVLVPWVYPIKLIKIDKDTGMFISIVTCPRDYLTSSNKPLWIFIMPSNQVRVCKSNWSHIFDLKFSIS